MPGRGRVPEGAPGGRPRTGRPGRDRPARPPVCAAVAGGAGVQGGRPVGPPALARPRPHRVAADGSSLLPQLPQLPAWTADRSACVPRQDGPRVAVAPGEGAAGAATGLAPLRPAGLPERARLPALRPAVRPAVPGPFLGLASARRTCVLFCPSLAARRGLSAALPGRMRPGAKKNAAWPSHVRKDRASAPAAPRPYGAVSFMYAARATFPAEGPAGGTLPACVPACPRKQYRKQVSRARVPKIAEGRLLPDAGRHIRTCVRVRVRNRRRLSDRTRRRVLFSRERHARAGRGTLPRPARSRVHRNHASDGLGRHCRAIPVRPRPRPDKTGAIAPAIPLLPCPPVGRKHAVRK